MLYNNIKLNNKCIFYMSTCCTSFENLGIHSYKKDSNLKYNYKEKDYIDILKHSSFNSKTEDEINEFINVNLKSLDRINIDKGEDK